MEDWRRTIENKECVIVRENGKIVTLYKWRIEGKKLYGNISVNLGAANLLYDLERSVFDEYWEKGIRTMYAWINCSNNKALKRGPGYEKEIVKARMYYMILFIKNSKGEQILWKKKFMQF